MFRVVPKISSSISNTEFAILISSGRRYKQILISSRACVVMVNVTNNYLKNKNRIFQEANYFGVC